MIKRIKAFFGRSPEQQFRIIQGMAAARQEASRLSKELRSFQEELAITLEAIRQNIQGISTRLSYLESGL